MPLLGMGRDGLDDVGRREMSTEDVEVHRAFCRRYALSIALFGRWLLHPQTVGAASGPQQPGFVPGTQHVCNVPESQHADDDDSV